jgi:hypothetical protein
MTRRVVTGHSPEGKAIVASDEEVEPVVLDLSPGYEFLRLWGGDEAPTYPDDGSPLENPRYFPPLGGFRFGMFTVAPDRTAPPADLDLGAAVAQMEELLPGMADHMEPDAPGMHTTDTVDFEYVVSGRVVLEPATPGATPSTSPARWWWSWWEPNGPDLAAARSGEVGAGGGAEGALEGGAEGRRRAEAHQTGHHRHRHPVGEQR